MKWKITVNLIEKYFIIWVKYFYFGLPCTWLKCESHLSRVVGINIYLMHINILFILDVICCWFLNKFKEWKQSLHSLLASWRLNRKLNPKPKLSNSASKISIFDVDLSIGYVDYDHTVWLLSQPFCSAIPMYEDLPLFLADLVHTTKIDALWSFLPISIALVS